MLDKLRKVGQQAVVYGLGNILNKLLGFLLIPLYISRIPINEFGILSIFEIIILFLSTLLSFGIGTAHQRFFYIEKENKTYGIYLFNNFIGNAILALIAIIPFLLFSGFFASVLVGDSLQYLNLQIVMWIIVVEVLFYIPLQVLQYEGKPFQFLLFNVLKLILSFSLTIYFVIRLKYSINGILYARLLGGAITLLLTLAFIILPRCNFKFNIKPVIKSIRFGLPIVISNIGYIIFMISDRYMLLWFSNESEVGKYSFGLKIANFINLIFINTICISYFPTVMKNDGQENNIRYYRKMLTYYCIFISFIILAFLFYYRELLGLVVNNKEYWEGLKVVPLLCVSFMVMGMNYFVQVGLFLKNESKKYLFPSFVVVFINILLNVFLIPLLGMIGAGISVLVSQITYTSLIVYLSEKQMKISFEWKKIFLAIALGIVLFFAGLYLPVKNIWIAGVIKLAMLGLYPLILYKLNFFEPIEIQRTKEGIIKQLVKLKIIRKKPL